MKNILLLFCLGLLTSCYQMSDEGHLSAIPSTNNSNLIQDSYRSPYLQPNGF